MNSVFISYSHKDAEFAKKLTNDLMAHGVSVWIDIQEIKVGDSLIKSISDALTEVSYIIVIISEASAKSEWVRSEVNAAFTKNKANAKQVLIPAVLNENAVPDFLRNIKYADFTKSYDVGLNEILNAILENPQQKIPTVSQVLNLPGFAKEVAKELAQIMQANPQGVRVENILSKSVDKKLVFVIISFSADMDPIFEGIRAAGEAHGLRVERVKDVVGDYRITDKIIEMIHQARLIVADLTNERPNVYFELGYARGFGKTIITTAREGTKLHFDVKDWTCTFYTDSRILEKRLYERFASELSKS